MFNIFEENKLNELSYFFIVEHRYVTGALRQIYRRVMFSVMDDEAKTRMKMSRGPGITMAFIQVIYKIKN